MFVYLGPRPQVHEHRVRDRVAAGLDGAHRPAGRHVNGPFGVAPVTSKQRCLRHRRVANVDDVHQRQRSVSQSRRHALPSERLPGKDPIRRRLPTDNPTTTTWLPHDPKPSWTSTPGARHLEISDRSSSPTAVSAATAAPVQCGPAVAAPARLRTTFASGTIVWPALAATMVAPR